VTHDAADTGDSTETTAAAAATRPTVDELRDLAVRLATEAGALALRRRREGAEVAATKSTSVDVVTHTDREVEQVLRERLAELRPGDGFHGEEGEPDLSSTGLTWVVDPIDGTVNFVYGIPQWAVSVAVVEGGADPLTWRALAAAVVNPTTGETWSAADGRGAWLGDERLAVTGPTSLEQSMFATGFSYDAARRVEQAEVLTRVIGRVRDLRRLGAASLDLCAVASGRLDVYAERGLQAWDHAAGVLVAREAGAVVTGERGAAPSRDLVLAAAPGVAEAARVLVEDAGL